MEPIEPRLMEPLTEEGRSHERLTRKLQKLLDQLYYPQFHPQGHQPDLDELNALNELVQLVIDGGFPGSQSSKLDIRHAFNPDRFLPW